MIAAINGNYLGGGFEAAMVCHYRVAARGVDLGQAEVQIGLIPGAGGTQRLPRLIGLPNAIEMIITGKAIKSEQAHAAPLSMKWRNPISWWKRRYKRPGGSCPVSSIGPTG